MDPREMFDLVVQAQGTLPPFRENQRVQAILDGMRRRLAVIEEPFTYFLFFDNVPTTGTVQQNINIQADSDFLLLATVFTSDINGAAVTISSFNYPNVRVLLTDTGNGRSMMDQPLPITMIFGNGQLPFQWPVPKLFAARSTLQVQLTSFEAANTPDIRLGFIGKKLYPLAGS